MWLVSSLNGPRTSVQSLRRGCYCRSKEFVQGHLRGQVARILVFHPRRGAQPVLYGDSYSQCSAPRPSFSLHNEDQAREISINHSSSPRIRTLLIGHTGSSSSTISNVYWMTGISAYVTNFPRIAPSTLSNRATALFVRLQSWGHPFV